MYNVNLYEKTRLRNRFKDIVTLALFTLVVAVISLAVMNILVYPMTVFAVNHKNAFNFIIKDLAFFALIALLLALIGLKIYRLKKNGLEAKKIVRYMVLKPFYYLSIFFFFLVISAVLLLILYALFSNNYYLLYKILN